MTTALAPTAACAPRTMTLRPAPRREPPFDDELHESVRDRTGPHDRWLPFASVRPVHAPMPERRPAANADLPDPARWGRRLLIGIIETAAGRRPLAQLGAVLSMSVAAGLGADLERAARGHRRHWTHAAAIRSVHASEPGDGVAELSATVKSASGRVRAIALRLEAHDGRWRCTRLQWG